MSNLKIDAIHVIQKYTNFRKLSNITTEEILVGGVEEITVSYLPGSVPDISWPFIITGNKYIFNFKPFCLPINILLTAVIIWLLWSFFLNILDSIYLYIYIGVLNLAWDF